MIDHLASSPQPETVNDSIEDNIDMASYTFFEEIRFKTLEKSFV